MVILEENLWYSKSIMSRKLQIQKLVVLWKQKSISLFMATFKVREDFITSSDSQVITRIQTSTAVPNNLEQKADNIKTIIVLILKKCPKRI